MKYAIARVFLGCSLALAACVTGGGTVGGGPLVVPVSGGAVGATCPKEDRIGCAPGAKAKVRCKGGVWIDDGVCWAGETCSETKSGDGVMVAQCLTPPTANTSRAIMCAKADHCLPVSVDTFRHPPTAPDVAKFASLMGMFESDDLVALRLDS